MKQIIPTKRYNREKTTSIEGGVTIIHKLAKLANENQSCV